MECKVEIRVSFIALCQSGVGIRPMETRTKEYQEEKERIHPRHNSGGMDAKTKLRGRPGPEDNCERSLRDLYRRTLIKVDRPRPLRLDYGTDVRKL